MGPEELAARTLLLRGRGVRAELEDERVEVVVLRPLLFQLREVLHEVPVREEVQVVPGDVGAFLGGGGSEDVHQRGDLPDQGVTRELAQELLAGVELLFGGDFGDLQHVRELLHEGVAAAPGLPDLQVVCGII